MQNFIFGSISGMCATSVTQPVDFTKVQIQVLSEQGKRGKDLNPLRIVRKIIKEQGSIRPLYKGLDSALLRQLVYCGIRFGLFYEIKDIIKHTKGREANFVENAIASLVSGGVGAYAGNPFDLILIRMQSDRNLPENQRRHYKGVFDAMFRIVKEEGVLTLWRGSLPTVVRAMAMNFGMMTSFEEAKKLVAKHITTHKKLNSIISSCISGFFAAFLCLPFDNIKTKLQKMKALPDGTLPYKGVFDCLVKTCANEGFFKLWVGFATFYTRVAPHAIISLLVNETLRHLFVTERKDKPKH